MISSFKSNLIKGFKQSKWSPVIRYDATFTQCSLSNEMQWVIFTVFILPLYLKNMRYQLFNIYITSIIYRAIEYIRVRQILGV